MNKNWETIGVISFIFALFIFIFLAWKGVIKIPPRICSYNSAGEIIDCPKNGTY
jgi:hypothetical protein